MSCVRASCGRRFSGGRSGYSSPTTEPTVELTTRLLQSTNQPPASLRRVKIAFRVPIRSTQP
eukprot:6172557-Prymnesium_polylepis.1